jgi:hypothetical protein
MAALTDATLIFLVVLFVLLVGVIIALYTRAGSGMNHHPYRHVWGGAPAADLPCEDYSGSDRTSVTERDVARLWRRRRRVQDPAMVAASVEQARARRRERSRAKTNRTPIRSPVPPLQ